MIETFGHPLKSISFEELKDIFFVDPVGSSLPQLPSRNRAQNFVIESGVDTSLLCEAQGSPVPSFRYSGGKSFEVFLEGKWQLLLRKFFTKPNGCF